MNESLQQILNESEAPVVIKQQAITLALQVAVPIAVSAFSNPGAAIGDGTYLAFLMELLKLLLPILLQLLFPPKPV